MRLRNYLLIEHELAEKGYPFGVEADSALGVELHGPFASQREAMAYIRWLRQEFDDYRGMKVVKIETPAVSAPVAVR